MAIITEGKILSRKNINPQNTIKFSIWETKTDKTLSASSEKPPEVMNKPNSLRSKKES
ncbi:hypothetical protein ACLM5H_10035 [Fredinandcohnia humi]